MSDRASVNEMTDVVTRASLIVEYILNVLFNRIF